MKNSELGKVLEDLPIEYRLLKSVILEDNPIYYFENTRLVFTKSELGETSSRYKYLGVLRKARPAYICESGLVNLETSYEEVEVDDLYKFDTLGTEWFLTEEDALKAKANSKY